MIAAPSALDDLLHQDLVVSAAKRRRGRGPIDRLGNRDRGGSADVGNRTVRLAARGMTLGNRLEESAAQPLAFDGPNQPHADRRETDPMTSRSDKQKTWHRQPLRVMSTDNLRLIVPPPERRCRARSATPHWWE